MWTPWRSLQVVSLFGLFWLWTLVFFAARRTWRSCRTAWSIAMTTAERRRTERRRRKWPKGGCMWFPSSAWSSWWPRSSVRFYLKSHSDKNVLWHFSDDGGHILVWRDNHWLMTYLCRGLPGRKPGGDDRCRSPADGLNQLHHQPVFSLALLQTGDSETQLRVAQSG